MLRHLGVVAMASLSLAACSSATSQSSQKLSPEAMLDMDVDMFGVVVDIPHRHYIGETAATAGTQRAQVYRWQAEESLLDRGSGDIWLSVQDLQLAGLPVMDSGPELDFTGGMYRDTRYRLAGTVDALNITSVYEVRIRVRWQLYDAETGQFAFTGTSNGFARGSTLGTTGIQPNAMLDAFQDCLGDLTGKSEFAAAIGSAAAAPAGGAG
jgi:hypothetical protein